MSFEAALVSFLQPPPENSSSEAKEAILKIHSVQAFDDEPAAFTALKVKAQEFLSTTHGEFFVGLLEDDKKIMDHKSGSYALVSDNSDNPSKSLTLWYGGSALSTGYIYNSVISTAVNLGKFSVVPVENAFPELKQALQTARDYANELEQQGADIEDRTEMIEASIRSLMNDVATLAAENETLKTGFSDAEDRVKQARRVALVRSQDYRRLSTELENARSLIRKDDEVIENLKAEITDLRRRLTEREKEMGSLREQYASTYVLRAQAKNNQQLPKHNESNFAQAGLANCFESLANFDRAKLKNRQQRDNLLAQKPHRNESTNCTPTGINMRLPEYPPAGCYDS